MEALGDILAHTQSELVVSKQALRKAEGLAMVRLRREQGQQTLGFTSRPFVFCGLPIRRPPAGQLVHERRNGQFVLQVTGHPDYGLPFGQGRLVPIFLATPAVRQQSQTIRFKSASTMLKTFGLAKGGKEYRRLVAAFQRVFGATIFLGLIRRVVPREWSTVQGSTFSGRRRSGPIGSQARECPTTARTSLS